MMASTAQIAKCPVFDGLSQEELSEVLGLVEFEMFPDKTVIIEEGKSLQILWVILKGSCEVVTTTPKGEVKQLAVLEPFSVFGEMSFFSPGPHSASVRSLEDVEVIQFPRDQFDLLLRGQSFIAYKIMLNTMQVLADRLRTMDDWTRKLVEKSGASGQKEEWREFRAKLYTDWEF